MKRSAQWVLLILAGLLMSACSATGAKRSLLEDNRVTADRLINESPLSSPELQQDIAHVDILEMTPEMIAFIDSYTEGRTNRYARMKRLVHAIMGDDNFELIYDDTTRTAAETFKDQRGNCLSFTNLFIAMARYLELHASYQEVDIPPDWSLAGDSFLFSQHVNVFLDIGAGEVRIVDFNIYDFNVIYERRLISDERARAHYFSNIGVDHMLAGEAVLAYTNFRQAVIEDNTFSPAWINMGILHRREGYPDFAETAYRQALEIYQFDPLAISNLANLYEEEGLEERAQQYRDRVEVHRLNNPYYRYNLAQSAVMDGDYRSAIDHLRVAIRKRNEEPRFASLLGVSYYMAGDEENARKWIDKAEELARDDVDKLRYHNKLDHLMSLQNTLPKGSTDEYP